jgi:SAM-dependent methyltransferase
MMPKHSRGLKQFYETVDREQLYTHEHNLRRHPFYKPLRAFIKGWGLGNKKCLEIGSAKGLFQDVVEDYTGVDVAENLSKYYHKKFIAVSGAELPFLDESYDAIFSYATHEHIPDLELALNEIIRVLRHGGVCLFAPAWHTRPWFAKGYLVRPYGDLTLAEKFIKLTIPVRDSVFIRWTFVFLRRLTRMFFYIVFPTHPLRFKRLEANYEIYWQSDSDACNSLDPFDLIMWFRSRNIICHGYNSVWKALFVRTYALELQKP